MFAFYIPAKLTDFLDQSNGCAIAALCGFLPIEMERLKIWTLRASKPQKLQLVVDVVIHIEHFEFSRQTGERVTKKLV